LKKLTINRKLRREETLKKLKDKKMTPEYGMNSAKLRLKQRRHKEEIKYFGDGWVKFDKSVIFYRLDILTTRLTAQLSNSVEAYNLRILLEKKWYDDKKNYKILNKLTKRQEERLSKVLPGHRL
jgi:hypothetical protein